MHVGVLSVCIAATLLFALSTATDEQASEPPLGIAVVFAGLEQTCFQEAGMTAEETTALLNTRLQATEALHGVRLPGSTDRDFLTQVDRYAPTPVIAEGIKSKWLNFTVCIGRETAKLVPGPSAVPT
ncbi:uncharacterized protein LOC144145115 [Haemaphysalis longicornis]